MKKKISAGLLCFRLVDGSLQLLLAHPGGPFFRKKDLGAWSIVKGEADPEEDLLATAKREFKEETGFEPDGEFIPLGYITQKAGKFVYAWAFETDYNLSEGFVSNKIMIEWPPKTGKMILIPEIDKLEYFPLATAMDKVNPAQAELITRLINILM